MRRWSRGKFEGSLACWSTRFSVFLEMGGSLKAGLQLNRPSPFHIP